MTGIANTKLNEDILKISLTVFFYVKDFYRHKLINGDKSEPLIVSLPEISQITIFICHIYIKNKFTTRILTLKVR